MFLGAPLSFPLGGGELAPPVAYEVALSENVPVSDAIKLVAVTQVSLVDDPISVSDAFIAQMQFLQILPEALVGFRGRVCAEGVHHDFSSPSLPESSSFSMG